MIDLVLAGDNAVVIGLAAAGLPKEQRAPRYPRRHRRRHRAAYRVRGDHRTIVGDRRTAARGRHPAAVGLLEDVARTAHSRPRPAAKASTSIRTAPPRCAAANRKKRSARPRGRSSSRTSRCRSTTYSRSRARRASILTCSSSVSCCRSRSWASRRIGSPASFRNTAGLRMSASSIILYVSIEMIYRGWLEVVPHVAALAVCRCSGTRPDRSGRERHCRRCSISSTSSAATMQSRPAVKNAGR